ncbi:MFS transporter [Streptomyces sp. NPDC047043]|uniref:MFS transporter n=1 Tax=Streptomyces sp. NPDC047043 TaxID=3154497 RepID=UPI0033CD5132
MSSTTAIPARRRQVGVLVLACLILLVDGYDLFTLGTVGPSLVDYKPWGATTSTIGLLGSVTAIGMPFGSALAGWAGDRWGRRVPMAVAIIWVSASMLGAALAPGLGFFTVVRFCTGIGIGALAPLVGAFVTDSAPPHRRTLHLMVALGALGIGGIASSLLGRLLLPDVHFQWLFLPGAVPVVIVPLVWRLVPAAPPPHEPALATARRNHVVQLLSPQFRRTSMLFWGATFMSMALVYSTSSWLPTVMVKAGYDLGSSLDFLMTFTMGAVVGGLVLAPIADRGHLRIVTLGTFLLAAVALLVLSTPQPRPLLLVVSALAGLGSLGCQNMVAACMTAFYPPHLRGTGLGVGLGVGRVGAMVGPTYLSAVTGAFDSPRAGFYAFMIPAVLGASVIALLPRRFAPSSTEPASAEAAATVARS